MISQPTKQSNLECIHKSLSRVHLARNCMMSTAIRVLMIMAMVTCLASIAHAIAGQATFYTPPYVPSSCYGFEDHGVMILAANGQLFANRAACGRRYQVRCTGPTNQGVPQPCRGNGVVVTVVDLCPGCNSNQVDLSAEAFAMIADPDAGRINIEYTLLSSGFETEAEEFGLIKSIV